MSKKNNLGSLLVTLTFLLMGILFILPFLASPALAAYPNIVPNPSVEKVSTSNSVLPQFWTKENFGGKNSATFSYLKTGYTGTRSLQVKTNSNKNVDAYYRFEPQAVVPGAEYEFSVNYKSNAYTEAVAEIHSTKGETSYLSVGDLVPSNSWNKFVARVTMPDDIVKATVYVSMNSKGTLTTDDYSLARTMPPVPLNRPIVTLTFDDTETDGQSGSTVYQYGYPLFKKYNEVGDIYIVSSQLGKVGMMSKQQYDDFRALGFEIGSHTVTHPHLTLISATKLNNELKNSQSALSNYFGGIPVTSFASPWGEYNIEVVNQIKKYYQSHRTTDVGFNSKDNFDPYMIKSYSIESDMSPAYVKSLIDQAIRDKTWLVLVYHDIRPDDGSGFLYTTTPEDMETVLAYLKEKNVATLTTSQAVSEIQAQM
jgi:peptidoglycan/xylan/chitin deacetylase (PgdA/CDA1 family)